LINALIVNALTPLAVPLASEKYSGTAATYITFFVYNRQGEAWSDDGETVTGHYIQVDVWSGTNCEALADQAETLMQAAGFVRTFRRGTYEYDTFIFHETIRFSIFQ